MKPIKAIVLSCDRYHTIAENMITQYNKIWGTHPFQFRVPWNNSYPDVINKKFKDKVELIQTGGKFKETFTGLTEGLDDNEWVYWCIDDKFLLDIDEHKANKAVNFVYSIKNMDIINVCLHPVGETKRTAMTNQKESTGLNIIFDGLQFIQHESYVNNWVHQFFRVKALREFWSYLREPRQYAAKSMDNDVHPLAGISLTLDNSICSYVESSTRGYITKKCITSCKYNNIPIPDYLINSLNCDKYIHDSC